MNNEFDENNENSEMNDEFEFKEDNFSDDFNFEQNIAKKKNNTANKKLSWIITIAVALFFGITIFIIFSLIFKKDNKQQEGNKPLDITNEGVLELYDKMTYGMNGVRYEKLIKEPNVSIDSLTNYDKFYYALSFVRENDLRETGNKDDKGLIEYSISKDKINSFMINYFGNDVKYSSDTTIKYTFPFKKENMNTGTLKYDNANNRYNIYFNEYVEPVKQDISNKVAFYELSSAETDGENVILKEKIIYPVCTINEDKVTYNCTVYRDFEHTVNIGEVKEVEKNYNFNLSNYNDCNIIEYKFTKNIDSYHVFNSSKIVY